MSDVSAVVQCRPSARTSGANAALRSYMTIRRLDDLLRQGDERIAISRAAIASSRTTLARVRHALPGAAGSRGFRNLTAWDARECDQSGTMERPRTGRGRNTLRGTRPAPGQTPHPRETGRCVSRRSFAPMTPSPRRAVAPVQALAHAPRCRAHRARDEGGPQRRRPIAIGSVGRRPAVARPRRRRTEAARGASPAGPVGSP